MTEAEEARANAQSEEAEARAAMSEHDGEVSALRAEVQAIERLLTRDADGQDQVLDTIRVDDGFEAAFGAALSDDLKAPEIEAGRHCGLGKTAPTGSKRATTKRGDVHCGPCFGT